MNWDKNILRKKNLGFGLIALIVLYLLVHLFGKSQAPELPTPKVVYEKPVWKEVVEYVTQTGTTVAYNSVDLVARIEGYLEANEFVDGSFVKKGQELFIIEPKPYMEQLKSAQATVRAQKAIHAYDVSEYARQQRMYKENATSENNVEKWLAKSQESEAEVAKDVASEEIAAINYSYTHVLAPFDGRIGRHLVDPGNLVGNGAATTLATVEQINPIYVYFNLNELDLLKLRESAKARGIKPEDLQKIPAYVQMQNETEFKHHGFLNYVNTGLNASTGTMEFRALFDNKDYVMVPGLFVQIKVPISIPKKQLTVPDSSILYDQIGPYLLLVGKNNLVELRRVVVGAEEQGRRPIVKGLNAQDKVIIQGLQFATPGGLVSPTEQTTSSKENIPS